MEDFNASTGTDRDGYETCKDGYEMRIGPHWAGRVNENSTKFLDFARSRELRVAGLWFQRLQPNRGRGIPTLVAWQRRLTMCLLMVTGRCCRTARSTECSVLQY